VIHRRDFITLLGGGVAWPLGARAQQPPIPVIGYLYTGSPDPVEKNLIAFRKGLSEIGFVEGRNVTIDYRWAHDDMNRLREFAADLARRRVSVIATSGTIATLAAKAATTTIPIVFTGGVDPVQTGLVQSLNRPGGNLTGVTSLAVEVGGKRIGLLHELLPGATRLAMLLVPANPTNDDHITVSRAAASALGLSIEFAEAGSGREIEAAFASLRQKEVHALAIPPLPLFNDRRVQLASLALHYRLPAIYALRANAEAGGLMSYGTDASNQLRLAGVYVGRVLKGEKPADLPVSQAVKFELVINLQTARLLGIEVPPALLAIADEVIE
jgi:putative ABC transport system substrate-binding protein